MAIRLGINTHDISLNRLLRIQRKTDSHTVIDEARLSTTKRVKLNKPVDKCRMRDAETDSVPKAYLTLTQLTFNNIISMLAPALITKNQSHYFLSDQQEAFFSKNGFLQLKGFVNRKQVALFLREIETIEAQWLSQKVEKVNGVPIKYGQDETGRTIVQRFAFTSLFSPILSTFLQDERLQALTRLLAPFEGRIGENEKDGLVVSHYVRTPDSNLSRLGWHTDSPRDLFLGQRIRPMLNIGLHLDDCPQTDGGLRILPGTHRQNMLMTLFRKRQFIDHRPDPCEVGFDIEGGDLTIHDGRLWHRVEQSPHIGALSRRRVMYIPVVTGDYQPKHATSKTPLYHRIGQKLFTL